MTLAPQLLLASLLLGLAASPLAHAQHAADHAADHTQHAADHADHADHAPAPAASLQPPAGGWESDAPLRTGMANIRVAVDGLDHHEHGHIADDSAVLLATDIQEQIAYLVANCELGPEADAALHVIIARLGAAAHSLTIDPADRGVVASMREALQLYALQFNDPTWPAPAGDKVD